MLKVAEEWLEHEGRIWLSGYLKVGEQTTTPDTPAADYTHFYSRDKSGVAEMFYKNDAGTERDLSLIGILAGTLTASRDVVTDSNGNLAVLDAQTQGAVLFGNGTTQTFDATNLFWDDTNNRLGIGTNAPTTPVQIVGTPVVDGTNRTSCDLSDPTAFALGVGGGISFSGKYNGAGGLAGWAGIKGIKENATDGNFAGALVFNARPAGGANTEYARISSTGGLNVGATGLLADGIINANVGYRLANAATSGNVLRGDGTNFISAQLALTDITPRSHASLSDLTADDHTIYRLESADHSHQATGLQAGKLDHGLSLTGLTDDDHSLYLLASDATDRTTFAANWLDLTDTGATTLHSHAGVALTSGTLAQFATTTSAQLRGVLSDENGTGVALFNSATSPVFLTNLTVPTIITASGVLSLTPATGSGVRITLATTGNFIVDLASAGKVGIGTLSPLVKFEVVDATITANRGIQSTLYGDNSNGPLFGIKKSRGSEGSPSAVLAGDTLGIFGSLGYIDAVEEFGPGPRIRFVTSQNWSSTALGSYFTFDAIPDGSTTVAEIMRIVGEGNIGIGTSSFGASAAKVLTLGDGTAPGALTATSSIVSLSGELWAYDAAGTGTQQTSHPQEIMDTADPLLDPFPFGFKAVNPYLAKKAIIDWSRLIRAVEALSGKTFATYNDLPRTERRDWDTDQETYKTQRDTEINITQNQIDTLNAQIAVETDLELKDQLIKQRDSIEIPKPFIKQRPAKWMVDRGVKTQIQ